MWLQSLYRRGSMFVGTSASSTVRSLGQLLGATRFFSVLGASPTTATLLASIKERSATAWSMSNSQLLGMERVSSLSSPLLSRSNMSFSAEQRRGVKKLKTHKGTAKRWRRTGSQHSTNWKRGQCGKRHLNHGMGATRIRTLRGTVLANKTQSTLLRRLLPFA